MEIEARAGRTFKKEISAQLIIHTRNSWNGEIDKLGLFVTSDNEDILNITRGIVAKADISETDGLGNFKKAEMIFTELKNMGIHYHRDPNIVFYKDDRVQYATETLELKNGDCDDLVVLYSSLLESLGINTAFVEVKDPEKDIAHVYLIFDTELEPIQGNILTTNDKRYLIREKGSGRQTIWAPIEVTLIENNFEEAWKFGATSYLKEGILRNGLESGWVKIIDVN